MLVSRMGITLDKAAVLYQVVQLGIDTLDSKGPEGHLYGHRPISEEKIDQM